MQPTPFLGSKVSTAVFLPAQALAAATVEGPSASTGIAIKGVTGTLLALVYGLDPTATGGTVDAKITESATTNGSYTDVTGATMTQHAFAGDSTYLLPIKFKASSLTLGFIRISVTRGAGASSTIIIGAVLIYGGLANLS